MKILRTFAGTSLRSRTLNWEATFAGKVLKNVPWQGAKLSDANSLPRKL